MSRYFFAAVPPEPLQTTIEAFRARWGHPHHNVEPHITIKPPFVWTHAPAEFLDPVRAICTRLSPAPARLGAPGRFASGVLYLTVDSPALTPLHRTVVDALAPFAPLETKGAAFTPHLTLAVARFGITPEGLDRMEQEASAELASLPPFSVTAVRCYHREGKDDRWQPLCDLPLGPV